LLNEMLTRVAAVEQSSFEMFVDGDFAFILMPAT
jgi:hypothetical protein